MIRNLYALAMTLVQPLLRRKLLRRAQAEPLYAHAIEERFGYYRTHSTPANSAGTATTRTASADSVVSAPSLASIASAASTASFSSTASAASAASMTSAAPAAASPPARYVWLHAVSLGETRAAAVLVHALRQSLPGMRLLLTHGTATGREAGLALLQPGDVQVWQPWDTPAAVARFLTHFRPCIGLLTETEVWPNWVAACARQGIPLCLVNARLSAASLHQAQRLAWLARPAYQGLRAVWAQTAEDAQRLRQLGAPVQGIFGNLKFDVQPDPGQLAQGRAWRQTVGRPVLMLASAREGEEQLWLQALRKNGNHDQPVQWLLVPRHPQRFDAVAQLLQEAGLRVARRSEWQSAPPAPSDAHAQTIWLGDSVGEMPLYYGLSDVALLGGSFAPLGGQNLIEAAACGCPVVMGPHTFNFAQAAALARSAGAAFLQPDLRHAIACAHHLAYNPDALAQARSAAHSLIQNHQGAAHNTAQAVAALLAWD
jgi:3-deoxy-D-manno-octulosonic-acid transferase